MIIFNKRLKMITYGFLPSFSTREEKNVSDKTNPRTSNCTSHFFSFLPSNIFSQMLTSFSSKKQLNPRIGIIPTKEFKIFSTTFHKKNLEDTSPSNSQSKLLLAEYHVFDRNGNVQEAKNLLSQMKQQGPLLKEAHKLAEILNFLVKQTEPPSTLSQELFNIIGEYLDPSSKKPPIPTKDLCSDQQEQPHKLIYPREKSVSPRTSDTAQETRNNYFNFKRNHVSTNSKSKKSDSEENSNTPSSLEQKLDYYLFQQALGKKILLLEHFKKEELDQLFNLAVKSGNLPLTSSILQHKNDWSELTLLHACQAALSLKNLFLLQLIILNVDANLIIDKYKNILFMDAIKQGLIPLAKELLNSGARVEYQHNSMLLQEQLGISLDFYNDYLEIISDKKPYKISIRSNILEDLLDNKKFTQVAMSIPLTIAVWFGDTVMVRLLIKAGGNPNHKTSNGKSLLQIAKLGKHQAVVNVLLQSGARPLP